MTNFKEVAGTSEEKRTTSKHDPNVCSGQVKYNTQIKIFDTEAHIQFAFRDATLRQ